MGLLDVGDIVFIAIDNPLYRRVAAATDCWTSHVGIIVDAAHGAELVAESTVPFSKITALSKFKARSASGQYSIKRLIRPLGTEEKKQLCEEAKRRLGILYHLGFNFGSKRQFCSKFVYEVYQSAISVQIGQIETFNELLRKNRTTPLWFWRLWFFGFIPWNRLTITPASQYNSPLLETIEEHLGSGTAERSKDFR